MTEPWIALAPIPQLFLDSNMQVDDFTILKGITNESIKKDYDIDFDEEYFNHIERELWVSSSIYVRQFDADESNFFDIAYAHFYHLLNILILFKPSPFFMPKRMLLVKKVKRSDGVNSRRNMADDGRYHKLLLEINENEYDDFNSFFKLCYSYFTNEPSNTIDNSILKSARTWLGKGRQTKSVFEREIFFSIVLESLVEDKGHGLTERIQKRCASFLSDTDKQYREIFDNVGKIYDFRSKIVHGEVLRDTEFKETYYLAEIIRCLLLQFISLSQNNYERQTALSESNIEFSEKKAKQIFSDAMNVFGDRTRFNPIS